MITFLYINIVLDCLKGAVLVVLNFLLGVSPCDAYPQNAINLAKVENKKSVVEEYQMMSKLTGVVKWFSRLKGYGFINPDDGTQEVFVHYSAIDGEGYRNLYEGDRVEYNLVDKGRGPQAQHVVTRRSYSPAE